MVGGLKKYNINVSKINLAWNAYILYTSGANLDTGSIVYSKGISNLTITKNDLIAQQKCLVNDTQLSQMVSRFHQRQLEDACMQCNCMDLCRTSILDNIHTHNCTTRAAWLRAYKFDLGPTVRPKFPANLSFRLFGHR